MRLISVLVTFTAATFLPIALLATPASADSVTGVWPVTQAFGVAAAPDGDSVWVTSGTPTNRLSRLDAQSGLITHAIPLSPADYPLEVAISPDGSQVFVIAQNSSTLSVVSSATNTITRTISLGFMPTGLAVGADGATIFVTDYFANRVVAVTSTGTIVGSAAVGSGPIGVAYAPSIRTLYVADQNANTVSVINAANPSSMSVIATIPVASTPRFLAVSPDGTEVWVPSQGSSTVSIIDTSINAVSGTVDVPISSEYIAFSPNGSRVYIPAFDANSYGTLHSFDADSRQVVSTTALGYVPGALSVSPDGLTVYVKCDGEVWVISITPERVFGDVVPHASLQQFARSVDSTCDRAPEDLADFPGLGPTLHNSAWGMSWAQWPNSGIGGFVCSRQPYYTSADTWSVE